MAISDQFQPSGQVDYMALFRGNTGMSVMAEGFITGRWVARHRSTWSGCLHDCRMGAQHCSRRTLFTSD